MEEKTAFIKVKPDKTINNMQLKQVVGIVLKGKKEAKKEQKGVHECALEGMLVSRNKQGQLHSTGC